MQAVTEIHVLLQSKLRLDRDKGISLLKKCMVGTEKENIARNLLKICHKEILMADDSFSWEQLHGCLIGGKCVFISYIDSKNKETILSECLYYVDFCLSCLQHPEVRVRTEAGEVLGILCKLVGCKVYEENEDTILTLLKSDLERHIDGDIGKEEDHEEVIKIDQASVSKNSTVNIFHESAGWRFLETTMKCLKCMINGCGSDFNPYINQNLLNLLFSALTHTNRFVRETGFNVCAAIVLCGSNNGNSIQKYGNEFAKQLAKGLADNWSQVRLASSVATRNFLLSFANPSDSETYFGILIPRLCLNRYYIAEGVRIYSQETWRLVCRDQGKQIVEIYIEDVVAYYIEATKADNHAVREAACACISELANKLNVHVVQNFVPQLLDALLECFLDDSWPVRDAACVACGNFILSFAKESSSKRQSLYELFLGNLKDPIPSVREGAGVALARYAKAYGNEVLPTILKEIEDGLQEVKVQPDNADKFAGMDKRPVQFGVAKNLINDIDKRHTDQQMYSCGSLAPKMGRGSGGCCNAKFKRPSEPWERTDGTIYLISELSQHYPHQSAQTFPCIVKALSYKQYAQHLILLETVCRQLPKIAKYLGKREFKSHLEMFIDSMFEAVACDVQLTVAAGEDCLIQLAKFIGPGILRGRIENYNESYLDIFDRIVFRHGFSSHTSSFNVSRTG